MNELKGSRIGIESVLYEYIYRAKTPEEINQQFETITLEQIYATILYYLHNKEEVSAYLADWLEFCRQQREEQKLNPSAARQRFRQLKAETDIQQKSTESSPTRYFYYQRLIRAKKIEDCCQQVREAVIFLVQRGEYPSEARVSDLISQPGYFRYKKVRMVLRDAKSDLTFKA